MRGRGGGELGNAQHRLHALGTPKPAGKTAASLAFALNLSPAPARPSYTHQVAVVVQRVSETMDPYKASGTATSETARPIAFAAACSALPGPCCMALEAVCVALGVLGDGLGAAPSAFSCSRQSA